MSNVEVEGLKLACALGRQEWFRRAMRGKSESERERERLGWAGRVAVGEDEGEEGEGEGGGRKEGGEGGERRKELLRKISRIRLFRCILLRSGEREEDVGGEKRV